MLTFTTLGENRAAMAAMSGKALAWLPPAGSLDEAD
jgi:hypothetical protein